MRKSSSVSAESLAWNFRSARVSWVPTWVSRVDKHRSSRKKNNSLCAISFWALCLGLLSGCSFVKTSNGKTTTLVVGGRGTIQATGVNQTYDNDQSVAATVGAAKQAYFAKQIGDAIKRAIDANLDMSLDDNSTGVQRAQIRSDERVAAETLRNETRQLEIVTP